MSDTEPEPDEPVIVDCDVLEAAKENIQPLASGRRVTALSAILSTPHAQRDSRLAAARNRHRINVEVALEDEDDDPLDAYSRFVYWVVENYPQGHSAESGLLELLEEATRVLKDDRDGIWRGDIRYLKLWVLYASYVEKPHVIFKFLLVNEIGTCHSLLYEEFAAHLERAGRKTEADETYLLGIARKAAPLERLEAKYREFQKRMMASFAASTSIPAPATTSAPGPRKRSVLGESSTVKTRPTTRSTCSSTRAASAAPAVFFSVPSTSEAPPPNARMQIFVDPEGNPDNDPGLAEQTWDQLGTRKGRIKENVLEVIKMAGTTVKQAGRPKRAAAASKIPVFRDPEPEPEPKAAPAVRKGKSQIAVFRDEELAPAPTKGRVKAKSSVTVFKEKEELPAPVPTAKAKGKGPLTIFRDEEDLPAAAPVVKAKGKGSLTIFRDEAEAPAPAPVTQAKGKSPIAILRDEEEPAVARAKGKAPVSAFRDEEAEAPARVNNGKAKGKNALAIFGDEDAASAAVSKPKEKSRIAVFKDEGDTQLSTTDGRHTKGKSSMPVFRDEDAEIAPPAPAAKKGSKGKSTIAIFRDEDEQYPQVPATPKFLPFRDDEPTCAAGGTPAVPETALKPKAVGMRREPTLNSEAEALRRDPFKNYGAERPVDDD